MFRRVLVANRGEIAVRIMETCRRLGVRTVAVYSEADAGALHVEVADQAVLIGAPPPGESYLLGDRIIEAAQATGAEAIHPGYGFLSENPDFAAAVEAAGLTFIGPSPDAIRAMGLKDAAKALMAKAGVPVVPGYHDADQDPALLKREAEKIGYPVLIKAVAGGGGKGMRRIDAASDFDEALISAQSEARQAFGNDAVLIEKYVATPRHIEVQVFGDGTRAVHLFERDCSLQRRHQKVIEEAPAPGMTFQMRAAMGEAAVKAAEAIGYKGAGTVEFIVDASDGLKPDGFWFMEMNTRLQVEHPVTEAITSVDLVEWQLRVASGEALPVEQDALTITGHAMEARLYAEDPGNGFLPATGTLTHLAFPPGVRADSGVRTGDTISPWYDPMIAKLTVHGATRAIALGQLERALSRTEVAGSVTNLSFLRALTLHEGFRAGELDTGLIARDEAALVARPRPCSRARSLAALGALGLGQTTPLQGFTSWAPMTWRAALGHEGEVVEAEVAALGPGQFAVTIGEDTHQIEKTSTGWRVDGAPVEASVRAGPGTVSVFWGNNYHFDIPDPLDRQSGAEASGVIEAPMPGLVKSVHTTAGDSVEAGARLVVLEAMKMEHALTAARDGTVAEVLVEAGAQVEAGAALIRLEDET